MTSLPVPAHRGLTFGGLSCAKPVFELVYGTAGAERVLRVCRRYIAEGGDPETYLEPLEEINSLNPAFDLDADGLIEDILPASPYSHARWNAFFYGYCASEHHAPIEAIVRRETGYASLSEAFDPWCPPEAGLALCRAIDRAERLVIAGALDEVDHWILDRLLCVNPVYDVTYPVYLPLVDLLRVRHIHAVLGQLTADGLAQVKDHMQRAGV